MSTDDSRQLAHTWQITCHAYRLGNGLLEIEATLGDEKASRKDLSFAVAGAARRVHATARP
ncbi:MAG: hypothetical protein IPL72_13130 [Sulfuritalea sp.]|nr:hypothetical protein [Sulfuritalea sp.]